MDSRRKVRKPHMQSSSSSDDSSSSSSDSDDRRKRKYKAVAKKQRDSSSDSTSEGEMKRKSHKHQHKKTSRKHSHSSKMRTKMLAANAKKELRGISPTSRSSHKHHLKEKSKKPKAIDEHERHSSRRDEIPEHRIASPTTRIRVSIPNNRAIQERNRHKDSPSVSRRHVREDPDEHMRGHYHKEKMGRFEEEEHYKYMSKNDADRMARAQLTPDQHHHEHRSQSHGRMTKRDEYEMMRGEPRRPPENIPPERSPYDYNDDRRMPDYNEGPTRIYEERGRRPIEQHGRSRGFEGPNWDSSHPHEKKRPIYEGGYNPKWVKDKNMPDWKQGENWKMNKMAPSMPHPHPPPRRWPGPNDSWRSPHPSKVDSPSFKPRGSQYFGPKRFPFKRFPSQYSKINFPSQRVLPSASETSGNMEEKEMVKSSSPSNETLESGEIPSIPMEEEKLAQQPDTTFSGNVDAPEEGEEGNLSEFSDVDDDILNREEVNVYLF